MTALIWRPGTHPNPKARVEQFEATTCGRYHRYRQGANGNWHATYLLASLGRDTIFIRPTLEALMADIEADHARRSGV